MSLRPSMSYSAAAVIAAGAILGSVAIAQAAMLPLARDATPTVQHIDCALGAHVGPLGGCILGNDNDNDRPPAVIERRSADDPDARDANGCGTKSVTRTDGMGNSETKTKTNC